MREHVYVQDICFIKHCLTKITIIFKNGFPPLWQSLWIFKTVVSLIISHNYYNVSHLEELLSTVREHVYVQDICFIKHCLTKITIIFKNGFPPLWQSLWIFKTVVSLIISHNYYNVSHLEGFSPVCMIIWDFMLLPAKNV